MRKLAYVFPGQGTQVVGMARDFAAQSEAARSIIDTADAVLGLALSKLMFEGPAENLNLTEFAQPAIVAASLAALAVLNERYSGQPAFVAGHSLGEFSALVCAGSLTVADALRSVHLRGRLMQAAVAPGEGAMAAVIGLDAAQVEAVVHSAAQGEIVSVAAFNTAEQCTISGTKNGVEKAGLALKAAGARRILPLQVSAPFHCPLMQPVAAPLRAALDPLVFVAPRCTVLSNVSGEPYPNPQASVELLIRQLTLPVRWSQSVQAMLNLGATHFIEIGPGQTLANMVRKIAPQAHVFSLATAADLVPVLAALS